MIQLEVISNNIIIELNGQTTDVVIELQPLLPATGGGSGGATNLNYIANVENGVVTSDTGTNAVIPLADNVNAGLISAIEKTKLANIEDGAEVNVNADWNATTGDAQILNKPTIPTKTSDLTNDGEDGVNAFITANDLPSLDFLSNDVLDYTDATLPIDPTNTLIIEQGGTFKKVAVSEISTGSDAVEIIDSTPSAIVTTTTTTLIKEYELGVLTGKKVLNFEILTHKITSNSLTNFNLTIKIKNNTTLLETTIFTKTTSDNKFDHFGLNLKAILDDGKIKTFQNITTEAFTNVPYSITSPIISTDNILETSLNFSDNYSLLIYLNCTALGTTGVKQYFGNIILK